MKTVKFKLNRALSLCLALVLVLSMLSIGFSASATDDSGTTYYVNLSTLKYGTSENAVNNSISEISLEDIKASSSDSIPDKPFYLTKFLYDGVGKAYVNKSNTTDIDQVLNINTTGTVVLTGISDTSKNTTVAVNANEKNSTLKGIGSGNLNITLKNATITNKLAPAIFVYHSAVYNYSITSTEIANDNKNITNVTLTLADGSVNTVSGGQGIGNSTSSAGQTSLSSLFESWETDDTDTKKANAEKVWFTCYNNDSKDSSAFEPYYETSGAISSDNNLTIKGNGTLNVSSDNEGIEGKGNMTFSDGGTYNISSTDDAVNANSGNTDICVDVNEMNITITGNDGDGIDSNGTVHIKGGDIFAPSGGQNDGIDSDDGTYINGGTVISTGNMSDSISSDSKQTFVMLSFSENQGGGGQGQGGQTPPEKPDGDGGQGGQTPPDMPDGDGGQGQGGQPSSNGSVSSGSIISISDLSGNILMAYKASTSFNNILFSSPNLTDGNYTVSLTEQGSNSSEISISGGRSIANGNARVKDASADSIKINNGTTVKQQWTDSTTNTSSVIFNISDSKYSFTGLKDATISDKTIKLSSNTFVYDGTEKKPTVTIDGLTEGSDFTVSYANNVNAGTATVTVVNANNASDTATSTFTINKANNTVKAKKSKVYVKAKKVKKKAKIIKLRSRSAKGTVTYSLTNKKSKKNLRILKGNRLKIKKGAKKGTYKINITATGTNNYNSKTVTMKLIVK